MQRDEDYETTSFKTMLPLDVKMRLIAYAKEHALTGMGTWDFGVALRKLLDMNELSLVLNQIIIKLNQLEEKVYEGELEEKTTEEEKKEKPEHVGFGKGEE